MDCSGGVGADKGDASAYHDEASDSDRSGTAAGAHGTAGEARREKQEEE